MHLLKQRNVQFDGSCPSAFQAIILAVCDYLTEVEASLSSKQHQFQPFLQATVIDQIRLVLLEGARRHPVDGRISPELIAATASWAIYGAVKQWVNSPDRPPQEQFVALAVELVQPIITAGEDHPPAATG